ncbi:hypothetical protein JD844_015275, partial [Phrynosoma platyrhinos]
MSSFWQDGSGALPGPSLPALQSGLHLCQEEQHPFHHEEHGDAQRPAVQRGVQQGERPEESPGFERRRLHFGREV